MQNDDGDLLDDPAVRPFWADAGVILVVATVLTLGLLAIPTLLLLWFAPAFTSGATCDVGYQPFCTPGYGMPQMYAVLATHAAAIGLLVGAWIAWARGRERTAQRLGGCAVACAALCVTLALAGSWAGGLVPVDWLAL